MVEFNKCIYRTLGVAKTKLTNGFDVKGVLKWTTAYHLYLYYFSITFNTPKHLRQIMPRKEYEQHVSGGKRVLKFKEELFVTACCDCGLVHSMDFEILNDKEIAVKITVMDEETIETRKTINFIKK